MSCTGIKRGATLVLAGVLLIGITGCSSTRSNRLCPKGVESVYVHSEGTANMGRYTGPAEYEDAIRSELRRQLALIDEAPGFADILNIEVILIEPTRETIDGKAGVLPGFNRTVHAAFLGQYQHFDVKYWFAACEGDSPYMPHVSHEVGHNTLVVFLNVREVHPLSFKTKAGKEMTMKQLLLSDARWPMAASKWTWRVLTPWVKRTVGKGFTEVVNGELREE